jgi:hypothetical protein
MDAQIEIPAQGQNLAFFFPLIFFARGCGLLTRGLWPEGSNKTRGKKSRAWEKKRKMARGRDISFCPKAKTRGFFYNL